MPIEANRRVRIPSVLSLVLAALLIAALGVACGAAGTNVEPEPDPEPGAGDNPEPGVVMTPPPNATTLTVALAEWSVTPAETTIPAGSVYFLASNNGATAHELVVIRSDLAATDLPTDDNGRVPEDEIDMLGEIEPFASGSDASAVFNLTPGSYLLICNIVGEEDGEPESHYLQGMAAALTVE